MRASEVRSLFESDHFEFVEERGGQEGNAVVADEPESTLYLMLQKPPNGLENHLGEREDQFPLFQTQIQPQQYVLCYFTKGQLVKVAYQINLRYVSQKGGLYFQGMIPGQTHDSQSGAEVTAAKVFEFFRKYSTSRPVGANCIAVTYEDTGWSEMRATDEDKYKERLLTILYTSQPGESDRQPPAGSNKEPTNSTEPTLPQANHLPAVGQAAAQHPERLPDVIVKAWEQAGADVGWMRFDPSGMLEFSQAVEGEPGDLPAFGIHVWKSGVVSRLPLPPKAFGLDLREKGESNHILFDAGLSELARLTNLQALNLQGTIVTDVGMRKLAALKGLRALNLMAPMVTDTGLKELTGLRNLRSLNLMATGVTDAGLKDLAQMTNLQTLNLGGTQVTGGRLETLAALKSLRALSLCADKQLTDDGLKSLAGLKSLQHLDLGFNEQLTGAGLKELAGLTDLQYLRLRETQVTDAALKGLARLTNLQTLDLAETQVTDAGMKELAGLTSIHELDLTRTRVSDAGLKELAGLTNVRILVLGGTQITDDGLKELAELRNLEVLVLAGTQVTDAGLKELNGLTGLQQLILFSTEVTDVGVKELKKKLPKCLILHRSHKSNETAQPVSSPASNLKDLLDDSTYGRLNRRIAEVVGSNLSAENLGTQIGILNGLAKKAKTSEAEVLDLFEYALKSAQSRGANPAFALPTTSLTLEFRLAMESNATAESATSPGPLGAPSAAAKGMGSDRDRSQVERLPVPDAAAQEKSFNN
jgi:Leucine-rich repeat (LRR) protein